MDLFDDRSGTYVAPATGPRRGATAVIVIHEAFGVNDYVRSVADRLAAEGYLAVAPDLFRRSGVGTCSYTDPACVQKLTAGTTDESVLDDLRATLAYLEGEGVDAAHTGIVGFCFGGRVAFLADLEFGLGAAVTFYGGGIVRPGFLGGPTLIERAGSLRGPWLGLFGDQDPSVTVDDVEALGARLAADAPSVPWEIRRYENAGHGFHCDARDSYVDASARDAWSHALEWFGQYL
ncbi:MAG: dienelactone hydrolase family protein [Acidimicrobiia bacterium]